MITLFFKPQHIYVGHGPVDYFIFYFFLKLQLFVLS